MGKDDPSRNGVGEIKKAGERAAALTRQLLAFGRRQILRPRALDLNAAVAGVEQMLRPIIGENIDFLTILDPDLRRVKVDPHQIEQVLMNLLVNALDAMPEGGTLTVETENVYLDEAYARDHAAVQPGPYVMLGVSDTGQGMDAETRKHIFEPFFTTKGVGEGTGLGLSTVYGIVKQSGGLIRVVSEPGQGAAFKIYLPQTEAAAEEEAPAAALTESPAGSETILLVEDEDAVRRMTREALKAEGYAVLEASNGGEALEMCRRYEGRIHLLLTDLIMPGMSGRELAERLSHRCTGVRVLFMSGHTDDVVMRHRVRDEDVAFLQKPFSLNKLARKVREILDRVEKG